MHELVPAALHGGVDDLVEGVERSLVAHHFGTQRRAVELSIGGQDVGAEAAGDRRDHLAARRLRLARQDVGVDHRGAPTLEQGDDGGLAGGDVAGEGDV